MESQKDNMSPFEIVADFANDYFQGDIQISREASERIVADDEGRMYLVDFLIEALHNYLICKNDYEEAEEAVDFDFLKWEQASKDYGFWTAKCLHWITELRGLGFIEETESMKTKLEQQIKLTEQIREEKDKLFKENLRLNALNKELHKVLDRFGAKGNSSMVE
jgi:hypothetical protein